MRVYALTLLSSLMTEQKKSFGRAAYLKMVYQPRVFIHLTDWKWVICREPLAGAPCPTNEFH